MCVFQKSVLTSWCDGKGVDPEKYTLSHPKQKVDLSVPWRFTGLPNKTVLEVVRRRPSSRGGGAGGASAAASGGGSVRVALQLPTGRKQDTFSPDVSLAGVATALGVPELIAPGGRMSYMRRMFEFEDMASTTLRSIGLVSGAAMFRVVMPAAGDTPSAAASSPRVVAASPRVAATAPSSPAQPPSAPVRSPPVDRAGGDAAPSAEEEAKIERNTPREPPATIPSVANPAPVAPPLSSSDAVVVAPDTRTGSGSGGISENGALKDPDSDAGAAAPTVGQRAAVAAVAALREQAFDAEAKEALKTIIKLLDNVLKKPLDPRVRAVRLANPKIYERVGRFPGGLACLEAAGFTRAVIEHDPKLVLPDGAAVDFGLVRDVRDVVSSAAFGLGVTVDPTPPLPAAAAPAAAVPEFNIYGEHVTSFASKPPGSESKGESEFERQVRELKAKHQEMMSAEPPARRTLIRLPKDGAAFDPRRFTDAPAEVGAGSGAGGAGGFAGAASPAADVDMEADDGDDDSRQSAGLLFASMRKRQKEREELEKFKTKAMRDLEELRNKKIYRETLIRVLFPDRVTMEGRFSPLETVDDVEGWLRSTLRADIASAPFYLYTSPPVEHLDGTAVLNEAGLVPAALIKLGWGARGTSGSMPGAVGSYIEPSVLAECSGDSTVAAPDSAYPQRAPLPTPEERSTVSAGAAAAAAATKRASSGGAGKGGAKRAPKWLKL